MGAPFTAQDRARLVQWAQGRFPGFSVQFKEAIWWERLLGRVLAALRINALYLTRYITTWGVQVDFPTKEGYEADPDSAFQVLTHELVHIFRSFGSLGRRVWYLFCWSSPQCLALLALLAFGAVWGSNSWLWWLLALLFLGPWPSPGRMVEEGWGYKMSLAVNYWRWGSILPSTREWIVKEFTTSRYYWMWPFRSGMERRVERWVREIESGEVLNIPIFAAIHRIVMAPAEEENRG